ncbi:MAG: glycosyltransferase family 2 protein [Candidatus Aminicenantes bacterium]|nr:glycosyltransferase family 2 protein [Candidatus Aminicenantes bacterium]
MKISDIEKGAVFHPSPDYQVIERNGTIYFWNEATGGFVETDKIGRKIFRRLPADWQQIRARFNAPDMYLSEFLLKQYLFVLRKSNIIIDQAFEPEQAAPGEGVSVSGMPRVSCVIVTFNSMRFIKANLDSLFSQTVGIHEVIVSDNGSTDGTLDFVSRHYARVRLVINKRNLLYTGGVNAGVRQASGEMILILNDDVVLEKDCVEMMLKRLDNAKDQNDVAGVVPQIRLNKTRGFVNGIGNIVRNHGWGRDNFFGVVDVGQFKDLKTTASACFAAVLVRREAWEKVGEMDEGFHFYDDVDWSFRAHMRGLRWLIATKALVYHEFGGHESVGTELSGRKITLVVKSRQRYVLKNFSGRIKFSFFRNYLREDLRGMAHFIRQGKLTFFRYLWAYVRLLAELPGIWMQRLRQPRASREDIYAFDRKNPPLVVMANHFNQPVVNVGVIRSYYYFL